MDLSATLARARAVVAPEDATMTRPRLLIIDDDPGPRASLRLVFGGEYEVHTAETGRAGVAGARELRPDIIILDIRMPDMSGTEALAEIRRIDPSVQVVMLTAYQSLESAKECLRRGANDYLSKPFQVTDLREVIHRCRDRAREVREEAAAVLSMEREKVGLERELQEAQAAVSAGQLSAGVVHEISTPLSIISAYAELLDAEMDQSRRPEDEFLETARTRLGVMRREVERCRGIARRLLDYVRPDGSAIEEFDAATAVSEAVELVCAHPAGRGVAIEADTPDHAVPLLGRAADLIHLVVNFGVNAAQACMGEGSIRVAIGELAGVDPSSGVDPTMAARWIPSPGFCGDRRHVLLRIDDTGSGIDPENMQRLFRDSFSTKKHGEGTGLGLFICRRIVNRYAGGVRVQSRPGLGTRMECFLGPHSVGS